jgi:hypothetical protein
VLMTTAGWSLLLASALLAAQQGDPFERLTVPAAQLPAGCRLTPQTITDPGGRVRVGAWAGLRIDSNPWKGTDRALLAAIRQGVDPPVQVPDGPPLHPRDLAIFRSKLADGVEQAYAAIYETEDQQQVVVYGVQFAAEATAIEAEMRGLRDRRPRYRSGRTVVVITSYGSPCAAAVDAHVRAVLEK